MGEQAPSGVLRERLRGTIVTSNLPFDEWAAVRIHFPPPVNPHLRAYSQFKAIGVSASASGSAMRSPVLPLDNSNSLCSAKHLSQKSQEIPARWSAVRSARAEIVADGLIASAVGIIEPSATNRFG